MIKAIRLTYLLVLFIIFTACNQSTPTLFLKHDSSTTNIEFSNVLDENSGLNILNYLYYYNGAGVAAADYNNDGLIDLYFTSNEGADKLYLNLGNFKFKEVSQASGIMNKTGWTTGVSNIDVNNDGLMDLYICKVAGILGLEGHNLLYLNKGTNSDGVPLFEESSEKYGLDFTGFSTQSVFLDYDLDGDLDMFLLNHSTHPNKNYGNGNKRNGFDPQAGDRFFKNNNGKFEDVSSSAGLFQGVTGYGLGVSVGDLNNDGYPDLYVGNDFFENDYLYVNQQDGTFKELISTDPDRVGHTTHYSMGNDIADINNDGLADIISLDMLPADIKTYKTSGLEFPYQTYSNYLRNGFAPQYMQNTLHLNLGNLRFSETAFLNGIAATEWSWSPLFADFDNDGLKDLFITNGIKGATNDMDYIKFISNEKIQMQLNKGESVDLAMLTQELPPKKVRNFMFKNIGQKGFKDTSNEWLNGEPGFSHGSVYADLDNDGDLDLVVNNTDSPASIYENTANNSKKSNNYLKVNLEGPETNKLGIGTKVFVYAGGKQQVQEHYLSRGYLSSLPAGLHFGTGENSKVDSVKVVWADGRYTLHENIRANTTLEIVYSNSIKAVFPEDKGTEPLLKLADTLLNFKHTEQSSLDFNKQILAPFAYSNLGPKISVGDLNNDGLEDIIMGGGKTQPLHIWNQNAAGKFELQNLSIFEENAISENTDQLIIDVEGDGDLDIIVVSGGNEFKTGEALKPQLYYNTPDGYIKDSINFENIYLNASSISAADFNKDGLADLFITANIKAGKFGDEPRHYLFENKGNGKFMDVTNVYFKDKLGIIQAVKWADMNADGFPDLVVVGHWISPSIYLNQNGKNFLKVQNGLENNSGWWNSVEISDFDNDGDLDIIAGNWGLNTRLKANKKQPLKMYLNDFDDNGVSEPVITYFYEGEETVLASKDELDQQMPFLKKTFNTYNEFAEADFKSIFPKEKVDNAIRKEVTELASCYFENTGDGRFIKHQLPNEAQASAVFAIEKYDFNNDGYEDVLLAGNNYEISTQLGRLDASHGTFLLNNGKGEFFVSRSSPDLSGPARDIKSICINDELYFIVTFNGSEALILKSKY